MTIQQRAENWAKEVGRVQAMIDCKRAIEKTEIHMDKNGFTTADLQKLKEYREILKLLQNNDFKK
jgi:hypothetical protein